MREPSSATLHSVVPRRGGMALTLVLAIVVIMAVFGGIVLALSRGAAREIDVLNGHLRAVAVAEAAYSEVVARLCATPWPQRWFKDAADVRFGEPLAGGTFDLLLRDGAPLPGTSDPFVSRLAAQPHQVDLFVRATWDTSTVAMMWRLVIPVDSLDSFPRAISTVYTFTPESTRARPEDLDPIARRLGEALEERARNSKRTDDGITKLVAARRPDEIAGALDADPAGPVADAIVPPGGGAPRPLGPYIEGVVREAASSPMAPPPPVALLAVGPVRINCWRYDTWPRPATASEFRQRAAEVQPELDRIICEWSTSIWNDHLARDAQRVKDEIAEVMPPPEAPPEQPIDRVDANKIRRAYDVICDARIFHGKDPLGRRDCP